MSKEEELFDQIVRPAMNDCKSLSLPDYRIIQGAVMQALSRLTPVPADGEYCDCLATKPGTMAQNGIDVCVECGLPRR